MELLEYCWEDTQKLHELNEVIRQTRWKMELSDYWRKDHAESDNNYKHIFYQVDLFVGYFSYLSSIHFMQSANPSSILYQICYLYFVLAAWMNSTHKWK